jgi:hypothetical protein
MRGLKPTAMWLHEIQPKKHRYSAQLITPFLPRSVHLRQLQSYNPSTSNSISTENQAAGFLKSAPIDLANSFHAALHSSNSAYDLCIVVAFIGYLSPQY